MGHGQRRTDDRHRPRGDIKVAGSATKTLAHKVLAHEKIDILWRTQAADFRGVDALESILVQNNRPGKEWQINAGVCSCSSA